MGNKVDESSRIETRFSNKGLLDALLVESSLRYSLPWTTTELPCMSKLSEVVLRSPLMILLHLHARNRYAGQFKAAFAGGQGGRSIEIKLSMHISDMGLGRQGLIKSKSTAHRW